MNEKILSVGTPGGTLYPLSAGTAELTCTAMTETVRKKYVVGGTGCIRRCVLHRFSVSADRIPGDPAQDLLLSAAVRCGTYSDAVIAYSLYDPVSRTTEYGTAVAEALTEKGVCGEPDMFTAELITCRRPVPGNGGAV